MDELRSCPFCGSDKISFRYEGQPATHYAYQCVQCGGTVYTVPVGGTASMSQILFNNPRSIEAWNRRAGEDDE